VQQPPRVWEKEQRRPRNEALPAPSEQGTTDQAGTEPPGSGRQVCAAVTGSEKEHGIHASVPTRRSLSVNSTLRPTAQRSHTAARADSKAASSSLEISGPEWFLAQGVPMEMGRQHLADPPKA